MIDVDAISFAELCFGSQLLQTELSFEQCDKAELTECDVVCAVISFLRSRYRFNVVEWQPDSPAYPKYMFLGGDRGILAYVQFNYVMSEQTLSPELLSMSAEALTDTVAKAYSCLDRPVFFVHIINTADTKAVLFETDEQIRDRCFRKGVHSSVYCPVLDEMGTAQELIKLWSDIKKNGVRFC